MEENIPNVLDTNQLEVKIQTGLSSIQMSDNSREAAKKKRNGAGNLWAAAIISTIGSSLLSGYYITVVASSAKFIHAFYNTTWIERYGEPIDADTTTIIWSITVSIYCIGGGTGSIIGTLLVKHLGRRDTLLVNNCVTLAAVLFTGVSERAGSFETLIIGRFISGLAAGVARNAVMMYLTEISPKHIRGSVCSTHSIILDFGILLGQVLGLPEVLGQESRWIYLYVFPLLPAFVQMFFLPIFPESPQYLLIEKNDEAAAEKALQTFLGKEDVSEELEEIKAVKQGQIDIKNVSVYKILRNTNIRWQLIITCVLSLSFMLCGINALYYYSGRLLTNLGIDVELIPYVTLSLGSVEFLATLIVGAVIELTGRRIFLIVGYGGMAGVYILLTLTLSFQDEASWIGYLSVASMMAIILCDGLGPGAVSNTVVSELFEYSFRSSAIMIYGFLFWMANFTIGLIFPYLQNALQEYVFLVFMVVCAATTVFHIVVLPETRGKTFTEITRSFAKLNKISVSDSLTEISHIPHNSGSDSLTEISHIPQHSGSDSLTEISHIPQHSGSDSLTEISHIPHNSGSDSLTEISHIPQHSGSDSLTEISHIPHNSGSDSLTEISHIPQHSGSDSLTEISGSDSLISHIP